jgi:tRNA A-37 threonylcarbamoyl transferase component Bud32
MHRLTDLALPGIGTALDCEAMRGPLARAAGAPSARCAIERVKYSPGRRALVLYRVQVEDHEQLFYGSLRPGQDIVLRRFPCDPKLDGVRLLGDPQWVQARLPGLAKARWRRPVALGAWTLSRVSYLPEHAYTARVGMDVGMQDEWRVYAKTRRSEHGAGILAGMRGLWASRARHEGRVDFARPLLYEPEAATLWQEELTGRRLNELAGPGSLSATLASRVGAAVAALHTTPIEGLPGRGVSDSLDGLNKAVRTLKLVLPRTVPQASRIATALKRCAPAEPIAPATVHGDLHMKNILVGPAGIGLIDFDDLCRAPAAMELGSFVAALVGRDVLQGEHRIPEDSITALVHGYRDGAGRRVSWRDLWWYAAAALIHERVYRCVTKLKPGRLERVDELLALAEVLARRAAPARIGKAA